LSPAQASNGLATLPPHGSAMRANALPITPTLDIPAELARLAVASEPPLGHTPFTPERWRETARAVQVALALLDLSKEELRTVIADDSAVLDAAVDELTGHAEFLDEVADLLRRAQARLQIVAVASVHPQSGRPRSLPAMTSR
jgi:hypothetical protein